MEWWENEFNVLRIVCHCESICSEVPSVGVGVFKLSSTDAEALLSKVVEVTTGQVVMRNSFESKPGAQTQQDLKCRDLTALWEPTCTGCEGASDSDPKIGTGFA